jgi:hypothetical protein
MDLLPNLTTSEWISLVGAVFTAGTVLAAYLAIRQGARAWRTSVEPALHFQILASSPNNETHLVLYNAGNGVAKAVGAMMRVGGVHSLGVLGDGFLAPADKVIVLPTLGTKGWGDDTEALLWYRTLDESLYAITRDQRKIRLRKKRKIRKRLVNTTHWWNKAFPDTPWPEDDGVVLPLGGEWVERRGVTVQIYHGNRSFSRV